MKHRIEFNPLVYALTQDVEPLRTAFRVQGIDSSFVITMARQPYRVPKGIIEHESHVVWAMELPPGALTLEFRGSTSADTASEFKRLLDVAKGRFQLNRQVLDPRRDHFEREGSFFVRRVALEHIRHVMDTPAFVNAAIAFIRAAEANPTIVTGAPRPRRPHRTVEERIEHYGAATKGPVWAAEEDTVLRMWFGVRSVGEHAGRHAKLEDHEWARVLELLGGMRTKNAVKNRLTVLNNQLRDRMLVNGFMPRDRLREYMQQALGEAPRRPPLRPYNGMRRQPRENRATRRRHDVSAPPIVETTQQHYDARDTSNAAHATTSR